LKKSEVHPVKLSLSVSFISVSLIAYQLLLIQILSIVQWYHFAYMIISVALLGFGAAGTILSIFKEKLLEKSEIVLPFLITISALLMAISVSLSQMDVFYFDSYRLFADLNHLWKLAATYLIFMLPFFFGALAIGLIFTKYVESIGVFYFANMVGSGFGGIVTVILMWIFFPDKLPAVLATLAFFSGILIVPKQIRSGFSIIIAITVAALTFIYINSPKLNLSEYKSLSKALNLPGTKVIISESSPYGLLKIISSNHLRYAPGLSITYPNRVLVENAVFNNGNWLGPLTRSLSDSANYLEYSTEFLPYRIRERKNVLVLGAGTGRQLQQAISDDVESITAVEQNKALMELLIKYRNEENNLIYKHPSVKIKNVHPRTFLLATHLKYDLITLPIIDAFGGTSGIYALQEQYLLTKEAFNEMFSKLTSDGLISLSTWIDYPYKNPLKILTTISEMLYERGIKNYKEHIAAIKNWNTITIILKRNPITENEIEIIRAFCTEMKFDPLILSNTGMNESNFYNRLQDESFYSIIDKILDSQKAREELYSEYPFKIKPSTDDMPYFSQFVQLNSIPMLAELFGNQTVAFFEIGLFLLYVTFCQILILSIILIITPLIKIGWKGNGKLQTLAYFSGIGLGYMFVEIILIQRFTLYFGNVIYSAAAVVSLMLVSSGFGSLVSQKLQAKSNRIIGIVFLILILLIFYAVMLSPLLKLTIIFSLPVKIIFSTLLITPAAFFMGMPFPIGLRLLASKMELSGRGQIPWAWGINGLFSVLGAVLAVIIAVELGFVWVIVFAIGAYAMVMVSKLRLV
jgi:spermidine synthase